MLSLMKRLLERAFSSLVFDATASAHDANDRGFNFLEPTVLIGVLCLTRLASPGDLDSVNPDPGSRCYDYRDSQTTAGA